MSDMFWIALELSTPKIGLNIMLSLTAKKLDAFKTYGVAESDNTDKNETQSEQTTFILNASEQLFRQMAAHSPNSNRPPKMVSPKASSRFKINESLCLAIMKNCKKISTSAKTGKWDDRAATVPSDCARSGT